MSRRQALAEKLQRYKDRMANLLIGDVPPISEKQIEADKELWFSPGFTLEAKKELIADIDGEAAHTRVSMGENAPRGNSVFAGLAFIMGLGVAVRVGSGVKPVQAVLLTISITLLLLSTIPLLIAVAPKLKVWRNKKNYVPAGSSLLKQTVENIELEGTPEELFPEFLAANARLHKRKLLLLMERRAMSLATYIAVLAITFMTLSFILPW